MALLCLGESVKASQIVLDALLAGLSIVPLVCIKALPEFSVALESTNLTYSLLELLLVVLLRLAVVGLLELVPCLCTLCYAFGGQPTRITSVRVYFLLHDELARALLHMAVFIKVESSWRQKNPGAEFLGVVSEALPCLEYGVLLVLTGLTLTLLLLLLVIIKGRHVPRSNLRVVQVLLVFESALRVASRHEVPVCSFGIGSQLLLTQDAIRERRGSVNIDSMGEELDERGYYFVCHRVELVLFQPPHGSGKVLIKLLSKSFQKRRLF